jgi:hypothetical protein
MVLHILVLVAFSEAAIDILRKVGRNHLTELLNVLSVDGLGKSQSRINNTSVQSKEVLRNLAGAGIFAVQARNERGLLAVVIELKVDRSLRKHRTLELVEGASNLGVLSGFHEPVLQDVAELQVGTFHECEELRRARVDMRCVDAAWLEETESCADAQLGENRECLDVGGFEGSAFRSGSWCSVVEAEDGKLPECVSSEKCLSLDEKPLEALDGRGGREQIAEELC